MPKNNVSKEDIELIEKITTNIVEERKNKLYIK
jgi:hypothetical protein